MKFTPGNLYKIIYEGKNINDPQPLIIALGMFDKKLHALNLNYLSGNQQKRVMKAFSKETLSTVLKTEDVGKFIERDPKVFYDTYVKTFVRKINTNCYRSYITKNIVGAKLISELKEGK